MAGSSGGSATPVRPGIFASHRGRKVRVFLGVALVASFSVLVISNALNGEDESATAVDSTEQQYQQVAERDPVVEAAPANPFEVVRNLTLPLGFVNQTEQEAMFALANEIAVSYTTYSASDMPEKFVDSVPAIDPIRADVLLNAEASWPNIREAGVSVTATVSPSSAPAVRAFDEERGTVEVEVKVTQNVTWPDGRQAVQTRAVTMGLVEATREAAKANAPEEKPDYQNFPWVVTSITSLG